MIELKVHSVRPCGEHRLRRWLRNEEKKGGRISDDRTEGALSATLWRTLPAQVGDEKVGERGRRKKLWLTTSFSNNRTEGALYATLRRMLHAEVSREQMEKEKRKK